MPTLSLLLLVGLSRAEELVIYADEEPDMARARVAVAAGRPLAGLRARSLPELVEGRGPVMLGNGTVEPCRAHPVGSSVLTEAIETASSAIDYLDFAAARETLVGASAQMGCLATPLDPEAAGRLHYLQGVVTFSLGDKLAAWAAFRQALVLQPRMAWDDDFSPDAKPIFDAARGELANTGSIKLTIVPAPAEGSLWVDGRAITDEEISLLPGRHLVQIGRKQVMPLSIELTNDFDAVLVIPSTIPPEAVMWAADEALRPALISALNAMLTRGTIAYLPVGERVWRVEVGGGEWSEYALAAGAVPPPAEPAPPPAEPAAPSPPPPGAEPIARSSSGSSVQIDRIALWGGGGLALVGGALATAGYLQARTAYVDVAEATTTAQIDDGKARFETGGRRINIGLVLTGVGVASGTVGWLMLDGGWAIAPAPGGVRLIGVMR